MTSKTLAFDTQHEDMIHDAQLNYYGKRLATCSSDGSVRIFDIDEQGQKLKSVLKEHQGPVWQVAWAHPKFGNILATCSYDGQVLIWKESETGWSVIKNHDKHTSSVNAIAWAPHELGPILACGSSDGNTQMLNDAHPSGVNSVSWAPISPVAALSQPTSTNAMVRQLATGGCDNLVKIWEDTSKTYEIIHTLAAHDDWVRDVAFAPNIGLGCQYLASCSQDKTVIIWSYDLSSPSSEPTQLATSSNVNGVWSHKQLSPKPFNDVVWRVSWSLSGNVLAVSCGDNKITLWKENLSREWENISQLDENGVANQSGIPAQ
ncbi:hypothetical protein BB561_002698 [Smittium simulii]|uniref:Uncharacterized protein n=1 Tax=Smittium simulii TaxID=133385 RepID=A0A2T9YPH4_9FUNG|nr:hypothetical protein BB561_002698 [Smittium simulii]